MTMFKNAAMVMGGLAVSAAVLAGCASDGGDMAKNGREVPLEQRYSLGEVEVRAAELKPGMTKADVYMLLGSPSEYGEGSWVYRGGVDGSKAMQVMFEDGRYVKHTSP